MTENDKIFIRRCNFSRIWGWCLSEEKVSAEEALFEHSSAEKMYKYLDLTQSESYFPVCGVRRKGILTGKPVKPFRQFFSEVHIFKSDSDPFRNLNDESRFGLRTDIRNG